MKHEVTWTRNAQVGLAYLWVNGMDPQFIRDTRDQITQLLESDPQGNGTPAAEGLFAIQIPPVAAMYEISSVDKKVTVVSAGRAT